MDETEAPRELAIDSSKHPFYDELKSGRLLPELKGYEMAYLFVIAMSYGVYYKKRKPIPPNKIKRSISKSFVEKEFEYLIKAVAISVSEEGVDIIPDKAKIYRIAEEYANGGIEIIEELIKKSRPGEFEIDMEKELNKITKLKI